MIIISRDPAGNLRLENRHIRPIVVTPAAGPEALAAAIQAALTSVHTLQMARLAGYVAGYRAGVTVGQSLTVDIGSAGEPNL